MEKGTGVAQRISMAVLAHAGSDEVVLFNQFHLIAIHNFHQFRGQALGRFLPSSFQASGPFTLLGGLSGLLFLGLFRRVVSSGQSLGQLDDVLRSHSLCPHASHVESNFGGLKLLEDLWFGQLQGVGFIALVHQSADVSGFHIAVESLEDFLPQ